MGGSGVKAALPIVLAVWALGAVFFPMNGMIHVLLVLALILVIIDRAGR